MKFAINWWIQKKYQFYEIFEFFDMKWNQIKYLFQFLKFIKNVINHLFRIKNVIFHKTWNVYDDLFNHLKNQKKQTRKIHKLFWIIIFAMTIQTNHAKLTKHNDKTNQFYEQFLNFVIILNFEIKLNFYKINAIFITKFYHVDVKY